jgi:hypothetical protein
MIIYIASPYTVGDVAANVAVQMDAAHTIMDLGCTPIWPLSSHYLHIRRQRPYTEWIEADKELVRVSDVVLRLPGESSGADGEVQLAEQLGIPVARSWRELGNVLGVLAKEVEQNACEETNLADARAREASGRAGAQFRCGCAQCQSQARRPETAD